MWSCVSSKSHSLHRIMSGNEILKISYKGGTDPTLVSIQVRFCILRNSFLLADVTPTTTVRK